MLWDFELTDGVKNVHSSLAYFSVCTSSLQHLVKAGCAAALLSQRSVVDIKRWITALSLVPTRAYATKQLWIIPEFVPAQNLTTMLAVSWHLWDSLGVFTPIVCFLWYSWWVCKLGVLPYDLVSFHKGKKKHVRMFSPLTGQMCKYRKKVLCPRLLENT